MQFTWRSVQSQVRTDKGKKFKGVKTKPGRYDTNFGQAMFGFNN